MIRYLGNKNLRLLSKTWAATTGLALSAFLGSSAYAATLTVNCQTDTSTFSTINDAIAASTPGGTIMVCPGVFTENVVVNVNNLTITATVSGASQIVATNSALPTVQFNSNGSTVQGFAISGSTAGAGVLISTFGNDTIANNTIFGNNVGVSLNNSQNNVVAGNLIVGNGTDGVLDSFAATAFQSGAVGNLYSKNTVQYNGRNGIFINTNVPLTNLLPIHFQRARILENKLNSNRADGMLLNFSDSVFVQSNDLSFNGQDGAELIGSKHNQIFDNTANENGASKTLCGPSEGPGNCTGIRLHSTSIDNKVDHNSANGNVVWDTQDNSSGSETAGTGNTWTANVCVKDSPTGLCD